MQQLKFNQVRKKLNNLDLKVFTADDLCLIFSAKKRASQAFLSYNYKKGLILRPKRGFYIFEDNLPHDFYIANKIYSPSYISLDSALAYYNLIPETVYSITSITSRKTSSFIFCNKEYSFHKIKKEAYTGYKLREINNEKIYIALKEKAAADYLYFVYLKRKQWYKRFNKKSLDLNKLEKFLFLIKGDKLVDFGRKRLRR